MCISLLAQLKVIKLVDDLSEASVKSSPACTIDTQDKFSPKQIATSSPLKEEEAFQKIQKLLNEKLKKLVFFFSVEWKYIMQW